MKFSNWRRREFLRAGVLTGFGIGLPTILNAESQSEERPCHSVIQIYLPGGIAHQELVDPKPAAPRRVSRRDGFDRHQIDRRAVQ